MCYRQSWRRHGRETGSLPQASTVICASHGRAGLRGRDRHRRRRGEGERRRPRLGCRRGRRVVSGEFGARATSGDGEAGRGGDDHRGRLHLAVIRHGSGSRHGQGQGSTDHFQETVSTRTSAARPISARPAIFSAESRAASLSREPSRRPSCATRNAWAPMKNHGPDDRQVEESDRESHR